MTTDLDAEARRLFEELIELDSAGRNARLRVLAPDPEVSREVSSLLAAAERAGDFLGLLSAPAPGPPAAGVVAGRYRIERHLGSGAVGDVHLAWDQLLERRVALKFLRSSTAADAGAISRFRAEARAAARLEHAHVATVYDTGETDERQLFIAMAYYPGETLRERIARGPLALSEALRIAAQMADALAAAHAAGIVHRDVKPANVLFDAGGAVRLADFGIAKLLEEPDALPRDVVMGTPAYMSPEQARGDAADATTDLWALGVMLHEMLTGRRPGADEAPARRTAALASMDADVRSLVDTLLADDCAQRPRSAAEVRDALDELAASAGVAARRAAPEAGRGALPTPVTILIGRKRELAAARGLLADARLLTLTGPGGTGKTRLSLELAGSMRDAFPDGVWFVPLAEIADAALVPSSVAQALGLRDLGTAPAGDRVVAALAGRRALLLLDNMEHVLASAPFVATLLAACPTVTVLATSRAPLGVQGEQALPVPPLATPIVGTANIADVEAVRLFVSRARAVRPALVLDDESLAAIAAICRRLEGVPLALELAAARSALLSPRAILVRLEQRFDLLRAESGDRPARHGTMRAVIDWSYHLLTVQERMMFGRLAVFAGGASLAAVDAVARDVTPDGAESVAVLDLVSSLVNKSLVQVEEQPDGEPRFVMLETVREQGLDRLAESSDDVTARRAHRAYFIALAEHAAEQLRGPSQVAWLDRLERDYANLRVALEGALSDPLDGLLDAARLAVSLHRLWLTRGPLFEGIDALTRILARIDAPDAPRIDPALHARVFTSAAHLVGSRSVFPEARELFARALTLYRRTGDRAGIASTLANLGWQTWAAGDLARGESLSDEALHLHEELGDDLGVALSRNNLAWIAMERGDYDDAEWQFEAVIASHERRRDARAAAYAMSWLGSLMERRGELARALDLHSRAIEVGAQASDHGSHLLMLVRRAATQHAAADPGDHASLLESSCLPPLRALGRLWPLGATLTELGRMLLDVGETARARAALHEALQARRASGGVGSVIEAEILQSRALLRLGDRRGAATMLRDALAMSLSYGARPLVLAAVEGASELLHAAGDTDRAAALLAAASSAFDASGARRSPRAAGTLARQRQALVSSLGAQRFGEAESSGASMAPDDAARLALASVTVLAHD